MIDKITVTIDKSKLEVCVGENQAGLPFFLTEFTLEESSLLLPSVVVAKFNVSPKFELPNRLEVEYRFNGYWIESVMNLVKKEPFEGYDVYTFRDSISAGDLMSAKKLPISSLVNLEDTKNLK